jgi:hypothetical protein
MTKLAKYFEGVVFKRLSAVETDPGASNQHEFNGVRSMARLFGSDKTKANASFIYLGESEDETLQAEGLLTWYDAREKHETRQEYRLYFQSNGVMEKARAGDLLLVARMKDRSVLVLVIRAESTSERQILWLFNIVGDNLSFNTALIEGEKDRELDFIEKTILETLGIEPEIEQPAWLEKITGAFGASFPNTRIFSNFARTTLPFSVEMSDADAVLMAWISHEEMLFRTLERHLVETRLEKGFRDVDDFIGFSLSVQNRRKSRMGHALENHVAVLLNLNKLEFSQQEITEQNSRPDFLFPGIDQYLDMSFPEERLTMLAVKSSCKERWNQVLAEANRINTKHLLTLEPGISARQTDKMREKSLQLVLPAKLHDTCLPDQRLWVMSLNEFLELVKERQS